MKTRDTMHSLPVNVQERIESFRANIRKDPTHREFYICRASGYLEGLRDAGAISEMDRAVLRGYVAV